jgi:hypothetical protein
MTQKTKRYLRSQLASWFIDLSTTIPSSRLKKFLDPDWAWLSEEAEAALRELDDLFCNRAEDHWMRTRDSVCRDHDQVDMLAVHNFYDATCHFISKAIREDGLESMGKSIFVGIEGRV